MSATGSRDTTNVAGRKYDIADVVSLLDVMRYPLLAILTNAGKDPVSKQGKSLKKKETTDPEFKWYEDTFGTRTVTSTTGQTGKALGSAVTLVLASGNGAYVSIGDVIRCVVAGYTFLVTNVSTDTLTLSAELGGSTSSGIDLSSLEIWIIGNANEEGAGLREIKGTTATEKTGYCQIFRTPFGVTETSKNTKTFIRENDFDYQRRKKAIEHMVDIERAFIFGKKAKISTGTHPRRFTDGVLNIISSYATANVDTEAEFESFLTDAFAHGNVEKYAFCGAAFLAQVNLWAKNKLQIVQSDKTYGIQIVKYVSAQGTLNLIKHDMFSGTKYGNYCVVLDLEALTYRYLSTRDTKLLTNRQSNGDDERVDEYLSEVGLQMEQESRHAIASMSSL